MTKPIKLGSATIGESEFLSADKVGAVFMNGHFAAFEGGKVGSLVMDGAPSAAFFMTASVDKLGELTVKDNVGLSDFIIGQLKTGHVEGLWNDGDIGKLTKYLYVAGEENNITIADADGATVEVGGNGNDVDTGLGDTLIFAKDAIGFNIADGAGSDVITVSLSSGNIDTLDAFADAGSDTFIFGDMDDGAYVSILGFKGGDSLEFGDDVVLVTGSGFYEGVDADGDHFTVGVITVPGFEPQTAAVAEDTSDAADFATLYGDDAFVFDMM